MKRFLAELFVLLLYIAIIAVGVGVGVGVVWWIACSDLPFWVKFWLLRG